MPVLSTLSFTDTRMAWSAQVTRRSHSCMSGAIGIRHNLQAKCGCESKLTDRNVHLLRQLGQQMIFVVIWKPPTMRISAVRVLIPAGPSFSYKLTATISISNAPAEKPDTDKWLFWRNTVGNRLRDRAVVTLGFMGLTDTQHWMESACSIICQQQRSHPSTSPWSSLSSRCYYFWRNNYFCEGVSHTFRPFLQLLAMTHISLIHFRKTVLQLVAEVCVLTTAISGHWQFSSCHWCTWNDFCALGIIFPTSC